MYAAILLRYIMPDALWADASSLNGKPQAKASAHAAAAAAAASDMSGAPPPVPSIADVSMASPTSPDATGGHFARVVEFVCTCMCPSPLPRLQRQQVDLLLVL